MTALTRIPAMVALVLAIAGWGHTAAAQDTYVQIEARPSLEQAEGRARDWAGRLDRVVGYRLGSGWYAIALGPFDAAVAGDELRRLRAQGIIPRDAYLATDAQFRDRFWPRDDDPAVPAVAPAVAQPVPPADPAAAAATEDTSTTAADADESPAEARRAEQALSRSDREDVQRALQAAGAYDDRIDGSFGPGTRRAMATWQDRNGFTATGILTTRQRDRLLSALSEARATLGLGTVTDDRAGISIDLPLSAVSFVDHQAPFARYDGETGAQVLLISQAGDDATLQGLFDIMQSLDAVPTEGPRQIGGGEFTLTGADDRRTAHVHARLTDGAVKGYALFWPAQDEMRRQMALEAMQASFRPLGGTVLPDDAGRTEVQVPDLLSGLQLRRPSRTASGFYVTDRGDILTAAAALAGCARVTIDDELPVSIAAVDDAAGLALLRPRDRLAPIGLGRLTDAAPRLQSEIAVAGYPFGGVLGAPTLSFGTLADLRGLDGQPGTARLALAAQQGDAGGPVLDDSGAVLGMLLPRESDGDQRLPDDVRFASGTDAIASFLAAEGISAASAREGSPLPPEDLSLLGAEMTVLVECWE